MKKIITRETFKNFTNINNNNNNNNNNDTNDNNTNHCVVLEDSQAMEETTSLAGASGQPGEAICSGVGNPALVNLPKNCRGMKFDLFDNKPNFKLKTSIIKNDGTTQELVAALNSPVDYIWRNVPAVDLNKAHWLAVKSIENEFKQSGVFYRASKLATPNKGSSTNMVVFLTELNGHWNLFVVIKACVYEYVLNENLTSAQRKAKMVASLFVGKTQKKLLDWDDLV